MSELKLIDRVVVEIRDAVCDDCPNVYVADKLREVANLIESGVKGGDISKPGDFDQDVLWEHEMRRYGGYRILSDKSLIGQFYYGSEPKPTIVSDVLKHEIRQHLDDVDYLDDCSGYEEIKECLIRANQLLVQVIENQA